MSTRIPDAHKLCIAPSTRLPAALDLQIAVSNRLPDALDHCIVVSTRLPAALDLCIVVSTRLPGALDLCIAVSTRLLAALYPCIGVSTRLLNPLGLRIAVSTRLPAALPVHCGVYQVTCSTEPVASSVYQITCCSQPVDCGVYQITCALNLQILCFFPDYLWHSTWGLRCLLNYLIEAFADAINFLYVFLSTSLSTGGQIASDADFDLKVVGSKVGRAAINGFFHLKSESVQCNTNNFVFSNGEGQHREKNGNGRTSSAKITVWKP